MDRNTWAAAAGSVQRHAALHLLLAGALFFGAFELSPALLTELRDRLEVNTNFFREQMADSGFPILEGTHPITPIMLGDAALASRFADAMLDKGIYVIGFSFPVVPKGKARIRTQISAAHTQNDLEFAIAKFAEVKTEMGI